MDQTKAHDFRANLREWMETAQREPIKITRKTGESFVLLRAEEYHSMQVELANLRGIAQGLSDARQGRVSSKEDASLESAIDRAKERIAKQADNPKKASGY